LMLVAFCVCMPLAVLLSRHRCDKLMLVAFCVCMPLAVLLSRHRCEN